MGARGPKPWPKNLHLIAGNSAHKSLDELEAGFDAPVKLPNAPSHLLPEARREWRRVGKILVGLGVVSELDRAALAVYCQSWARLVEVERKLKAMGVDGLVDYGPEGQAAISAWLTISTKCVEQLRRVIPEFGMTPSARSRIEPAKKSRGKSNSGKTGTDRFFVD